ncbi:MAG TPA: Mrp/NBP35 family ATP-binding protein [Thermoplasmata archaeon]|nr:Mrp/NBP35 family ATP-binding protein [Thermoplasmata archaeon]
MTAPADSGEARPTSSPPGSAPPRRAGNTLQRMPKGNIGHVVAVGSGKGGVGKSTATALLAVGLQKQGFKVGILDADVTGPSIPKLFGLTGPLVDRGEGIEPARTPTGVPVVSSQFLVEDEQTPVIWRGPLVTRLIIQFFGGVNWGPLDYLLIDMPPGTSDVPLTVFQTIPIDGMLFVFTPQELAALIVKKAMNMARDLHVPLLGIVENMAFLDCPHCQHRIDLFGPSRVAAVAEEYGVPIVAQLPVDPAISIEGDAGAIAQYSAPALDAYTRAFLAAMDDAKKSQLTVL